MGLDQIAAFVVSGIIYALVIPSAWRGWVLFVGSVIAIYWLQPPLNIRWLDYSLPTVTLILTFLCWLVTTTRHEANNAEKPLKSSHEQAGAANSVPQPETALRALRLGGSSSSPFRHDDLISLAIIILIVLALTLPRYVSLPFALTARPPEIVSVIMALTVVGVLALLFRRAPARLGLMIVSLIALFLVIKTAPLATLLSGVLRLQSGQDISLASPLDLEWLGFSYIAFRLIHTLRDRQMGLLPALSLREYVTYVVFFPSYTAGPIDRAERFSADYRALTSLNGRDAARITEAGGRIALGLFKKFVIADSLAVLGLGATTAAQAQTSGALWLMLYAYAFRLYFDFSGYTDIAIGIGKLYGVTLPENFNRPYLKNHLAAFWQSWHMTLGAWARAYIYAPLSRGLLRSQRKLSNDAIILLCNLATMGVIGLWHGVTLSFLVWGVWHGIGLTVHKYWSDRTRAWYRGLNAFPRRKQAWTWFGVALTFHFVLLGWVWFALPEMSVAINVLLHLFGLNTP